LIILIISSDESLPFFAIFVRCLNHSFIAHKTYQQRKVNEEGNQKTLASDELTVAQT